MTYRQGNQSPVNIWETRDGEEDRQVAMARNDHWAAELVRLANLGLQAEAQRTANPLPPVTIAGPVLDLTHRDSE